jgi:hypothetical protein
VATGRPSGVVQGNFSPAAPTDECKEDVFEARLLLDLLDSGGRQQRLELGERAVDGMGELLQPDCEDLRFVARVLSREHLRDSQTRSGLTIS